MDEGSHSTEGVFDLLRKLGHPFTVIAVLGVLALAGFSNAADLAAGLGVGALGALFLLGAIRPSSYSGLKDVLVRALLVLLGGGLLWGAFGLFAGWASR